MRTLLAVLMVLAAGGPLDVDAAIPPVTPLAEKVHRHPDLHVIQRIQPVAQVPAGLSAALAFFDPRAGRVTSLVLSEPLIPGAGIGNDLEWAIAPLDEAALRDAVWRGVVDYLQRQQAALRLDLTELSPPRIAVHEKGDLIQAWSQRLAGGIPVRGSGATAIVNRGNLVLLGLEHWGDVRAAMPLIEAGDARRVVEGHVEPFVIEFFTRDTRLEYIPMARDDGYDYRLAWVVSATIRGDLGNWEGLVDAASGELLAFDDTNQYARHAIGGVYPVGNDQRPPDGIEQPGWPLPFLDLTTPAGTVTTNSSGSFGCLSGSVSTALTGRSTRINEGCGAINESSVSGDLDLGFGPAPASTDCVVPPGHSAGDTKAARTAFHELTRINEQARGYLPANAWLQTPLTANVNVNNTCGALWNGSSITLYRDNGGPCRNPGEIASILDHEWGHGMDANGVNPNLSQPFEAIADVHALLRLDASCIGRGFFRNMVCSGYGDPCTGDPATGCTGVREVDFAGHVCGRPHTVTWITSGFPAGHCVDGVARPACPSGSPGPCGRLGHCESHVVSETAFDLGRRDLPAAGLDPITSRELATRLFFLASQAATSWYTCAVGGGCAATGGYMLTLAADDDDGNIANGTPHMTAIRAAFERHQIHCATPPAVDSGCASGPTQAPVATATAGPERIDLAWTAVPNAARYFVYRSDGVSGCDYGRIKVAEVTSTGFADIDLLGGHAYSYTVLPVGSNSACFGRASNCVSATPSPDPCVAQADFTLSCAPSTLIVTAGASGQSTCTVGSQNAFSAPVTLSCSGLPAAVTCSYNPPSPTPPANGSVASTLTVTVGAAVPPGTYNFQARGVSGPLTHTFAMTLNVSAVSVAPQALALDPTGNGVFQPGETVIMAPTWRNTGAAAITLTGATTSHTGPPGGTYSNPDAAAAYGVIAAGGQSMCTDCYTVRATAATRPLTHWDSTILETVNPSNTTQTWTLHIGDSFTDVPASSPFFRFVETILHKNVTGGCTASAYCPTSSTTRQQMAVFVLVAKEPPGYQPPACSPPNLFTDVPETSPFCRWIEELANRGVVAGCAANAYCPTAPVSRQQMAVFVLRTLDPALNPPACAPPNLFDDVPETSPFCRWIEELANRGVVTGCGGGNYCPTADVSREQMSVFLAATFGLALYGP
jgi:hypothetical protein